MATIRERSGSFNVQIRNKGIEISKTFSKLEDAELWSMWKEDLIDNMDNFNPPVEDLICLRDAIDLKVQKLQNPGHTKKEIADYENLVFSFEKFCTFPINKITYDQLLDHFEYLMTVPIRRGGGKDPNTGIKKLPSPVTIFRKFSYLSTIYEMLINDGLNLNNEALKVCKFLRPRIFIN